MPSWKKVILSGSDATLNSLYVNGPITGSDIQIDNWGSVSASLAAISTTGSSQTLQQVTDNGNTTTNDIVVGGITASGLIYPATDGVFEGQVIQTDAAGTLSFGDPTTTYETIFNGEATTLIKGTPVYVSGSNGANPKVYRADASNASKMPVVYIVSENITTASTGRGILLGTISGIDLTGYTPGQEVYIAPGGGWTSTRPTGSAIVQFLGIITKEGSGGKGLVLNPGPATLPNLTTNNVWVGDSNSYPVAVSTASLFVTSGSYAINATSASHALNANNAITASYVASASYIPTLDQVTDAGNTTTNSIKLGNSITLNEGFQTTTEISSSGGKLALTAYNEIVGINIYNPTLLEASAGGLHVHKNTGGQASIRLTVVDTGSSAGSVITHNITAGNDLYIQNRASGSIFLGTNVASTGTNQFTLDTSGNLTVSGPTTSFGSSANPGGQIVLYSSNSTPGYLRFNDGVGISSSPGYIKYDHSTNDLTFGTNTFEGFKMDIDRRIKFNAYGSGTVTGSAAYLLAVDSLGNIIENPTTVVSASHAIFADTASFLPSDTNLNINSISASNAVFQSASIGFLQTVTGSATIIGDAFILLNTGDSQRYAGLLIEDSGSAPTNYTASFFYDSQLNDWNYEYTTPGGTDYGVALFGPEYNTKGSPTYLTANRIPKAEGTHHLVDSNISDDGARVSTAVSLTVTGSITGSDVQINQWGSISASLASIEAGVATQTLQDVTDNGNTTTNSITAASFTGSLFGTASYASQALTSSYSLTATSASHALTASYVATASYTPTLQQVTTQGSITNTSVTFTGSSANSLQIVNSSGDIPYISVSGSVAGPTPGRLLDVVYNAISVTANATTTIAELPAPKVAGFTFDYIAYVGDASILQAGRAGVVKGILRNANSGAGIAKGFQINETTTLDLTDQGFGTAGLQFTIVQDTNGTSNQLVAITNNDWPYTINYTLTIYYNPTHS